MTQAAVLAQLGNTPLGMRNRIINGAMEIDQRNAGASVTVSGNSYYLDRYQSYATVASKMSIQQNAGSVTPPDGYTNYLGVTSLSAYSLSASDQFRLQQKIEGYNIADLGFGTANAKTFTLSFWVRSSLTGTFGGAFNNSGYLRSYPFTYTINSANTWEKKTITVAGDTSGTWNTTNGQGLIINFGLGIGSDNLGTAGSWTTNTYISATGATSVVGTSGATWYITGVQLEVGSVATEFERRPFGMELMLCQRYYEKSYDIDTAIGASTYTGAAVYGGGTTGSTASFIGSTNTDFKVHKRATPTIVWYDMVGNSNKIQRWQLGVHNTDNQTVTTVRNSQTGIGAYSGSGTSASGLFAHWTATAEL